MEKGKALRILNNKLAATPIVSIEYIWAEMPSADFLRKILTTYNRQVSAISGASRLGFWIILAPAKLPSQPIESCMNLPTCGILKKREPVMMM